MNRRGGDKMISVYWFAILLIVAGAVVYMVISYYGNPYDVREIEADALVDKVADCVSENGYLKEGVLEEDFGDNFLENCDLNFEVENVSGWEDGQYYVEVSFSEFNKFNGGTTDLGFEISEGNVNLKGSCDTGKSGPVCLEREFYGLGQVEESGDDEEDTKSYLIKILGIVRKTEKNVA